MYIEIYRIILTQDLSFEWIDQFLTVSDIPLEGTDNASIVRPQAKRKMSSNPSSNIFFCHSSSPEVDCCPGPREIVNCPEVGSSLSFLATTSTFYTWSWQKLGLIQTIVYTCPNKEKLFQFCFSPNSQFCACFSFSCRPWEDEEKTHSTPFLL